MKLSRILFAVAIAAGCDSAGTAVGTGGDAAEASGPDATAFDDSGSDDSSGDDDAGSLPPFCGSYDAATFAPSDDCIFTGPCPLDCSLGTASAYACAAEDASAIGTYPSVFTLPLDPLTVIAYQPSSYPWDAAAFVSCAPLACVRWSFADHVDGGSAWASDPCGNLEGGAATQAWTCPTYPGLVPPLSGCSNAGDGMRIGGPGTEASVNVVWCCPALPDAGTPSDGGSEASGDGGGMLDSGPG